MLRIYRGEKVKISRSDWRRIREMRVKLIRIAGGECNVVGCHVSEHECLEFHHVNKRRKRFKLSGMSLLKREVELFDELNMCVLLCCNHHKMIERGTIDHTDLRDNVRHLL
jgi:hypothetical protein